MTFSEHSLEWEFLDQKLILLPQKAIFWKNQKALIVADLHIGKVGHFRKAGIAIPKIMEQEELSMLSDLIYEWNPEKVIFLGDLFHSEHNSDWNWLELWRSLFSNIEMILIKGNHDILHADYYEAAQFSVYSTYSLTPFTFVHEPLSRTALDSQNDYILCGHIHPGVKLRGPGRQNVKISCFYFAQKQGILPAFGKFTGNYCLTTENSPQIFGVVNKKVVML